MERTRLPKNQQVKVFSEMVSRASLAARLGRQYGTDRNLYEALGYKTTLTYEDFLVRYERQDIAKAIIDRPVNATWQGSIHLVENPDKEDTALEKEWKTLSTDLNLKNKFARLDRLSGIGQYGVLLLGLSDAGSLERFARPVLSNGNRKLKLRYVKPFGEDNAKIRRYVSDPKNPRYGLPELYDITIKNANDQRSRDVRVHHSRVIHIVGESLESEVLGIPRLEAVYNRLMDLEKLIGGDAEMFWRGARPGYQGKIKDDFQMTDTMYQDLKDQIDEFEHNLRRILVNEGIDLEALMQEVADPLNHVDVQLQMISAVTGIPKRILTGTERGELASTQDKQEWLSFVESRRDEYAEPNIIRPFVDRCMQYGVLPSKDVEYEIIWQDLFVLNEKARVEVGKGRAQALREYSQNPLAQYIIPAEAFVEIMLGLAPHEIARINTMREDSIDEEDPLSQLEEAIFKEENNENDNE